MEEKSNIFGMVCFIISSKVKNTTEMQKRIWQCSCCDGPKVSKVVCEVLWWRFLAESMVNGLVVPVEVDSYQIEILIAKNQCGR